MAPTLPPLPLPLAVTCCAVAISFGLYSGAERSYSGDVGAEGGSMITGEAGSEMRRVRTASSGDLLSRIPPPRGSDSDV